jgi:hypothetical protein
MRTRMSFEGPRVKPMHAKAGVLGLHRTDLPPYQVRICARCGRETTFVLEDPAGRGYSCVRCGGHA